MIFRKATKDNEQNHKMLGERHIKDLEQVFPKQDYDFFSLDCCRQRQFHLDSCYFVHQLSVLHTQFLKSESRKKD